MYLSADADVYAARSRGTSETVGSPTPAAASTGLAAQRGAVARVPFGGHSPSEVLLKLVKEAEHEDGSFSIWGLEVIELWLQRLRPGLMVAFQGDEGVGRFLELAVPRKL